MDKAKHAWYSSWKAATERVVEGMERQAERKREELASLENSIAGARGLLALPPSVVADFLPSEPTQNGSPARATPPPAEPNGQFTLMGSLREAIAAQAGQFTNQSVFEWVNQQHPGVFKPEQISSVSSIMAKFGNRGLLRKVAASPGRASLWEKVPGRWPS